MRGLTLTRQTWLALSSASAFVVLAFLLAVLPVPFVVYSPGRTYDVMGNDPQGRPVVDVAGTATYPTTGRLAMTTVAVTRSDANTSLPEAMFAYWASDRDALPRDAVYDPGKTTEEVRAEERQMMDTSKQDSVVAALRAADVPVQELPVVAAVTNSGPASGRLNPGDLILSIDSHAAKTPAEVRTLIQRHQVGDMVRLTVQRERRIVNVDVISVASNQDPKMPVLGIQLGVGYRYEPVVTFGVSQEIGGPSAGLVFALTVYDRITPGDLLRGRSVAGTGEIDPQGRVRPIGGIQEKIAGAERSGATVFLVPANNCKDLTGLQTRLELIRVDTLDDAVRGLRELGGTNPRQVPRC